MKKLLLPIYILLLAFATSSVANAGRYNPPPIPTFNATITGPVANGGSVTSSPITITINLDRTATKLTNASFEAPVNYTMGALNEKVILNTLTPFGNGTITSPNDIASDGAGNTYVTDAGNKRVAVFLANGNYSGSIGTAGTGNGQFTTPYGIALDGNGKIYVTDAVNNNIQVFDSSSGGYLSTMALGAAGTLSSPRGLYFDRVNNELYIADYGNNRVVIYSISNGASRLIGGTGTGNGQFYGPSGVVIANGSIYVTDSGNQRVEKFNLLGAWLANIGTPGAANGQFGSQSPTGITTDGTGKIYVVDRSNSRIEVFDTSGVFLGTAGTLGIGNGNLRFPSGIAADQSGNIYVTNGSNNRIEKFFAKEQYTVNLTPTDNGPLTVDVTLKSEATTDNNGEFNTSASYSVTYTATPASPVLEATALDGGYLLKWNANSPSENILQYKIYQGTSQTDFNTGSPITVDASDTSYNSTTSTPLPISNGQTLYFYVTAVSGSKESNPSNIVSVTPKGIPTITTAVSAITKTYGDAAFDVDALLQPTSASSGAFSYSLLAGSTGVTLNNKTITITGAGSGTLVITQAATATYAAATLNVPFTINRATPQINWTVTTPITYGTALDASYFTATATKAGTTTPVLAGSPNITYSFSNSPIGVGTVLPAGDDVLTATYTPISPDDANYSGNTKNVTIHVGKATPLLTWAVDEAGTYNYGYKSSDLALAAAADVSGTQLPGTFTYTYSPVVDANNIFAVGHQSLKASFTTDPAYTANYESTAEITKAITIGKAAQHIDVTGTLPDRTFGDAPFKLSDIPVTATSSAGLPVVTTIKTGPATIASDGTITLTGKGQVFIAFNSVATSNYTAAQEVTVNFMVDSATPSFTWNNPSAITYGTEINGTQLNAVAGVPGTYVYTPSVVSHTVLHASTTAQPLSVVFTPDDPNYGQVNKTVYIIVNKADPAITWTLPLSVPYGTKFGEITTRASSGSVDGTLSYDYADGDVLPINITSLTAHFVPSNTTDYNSVNPSFAINVTAADPVITWNTLSPIVYGTSLAGLLNASSNGGGNNFTYNHAETDVLDAGLHQALTATFTSSDPAHYNSGSKTIYIDVLAAQPTINLTGGPITGKSFGDAPFQNPVTGTSSVNLPVVVTIQSGNATISNTGEITLTGKGQVVIAYSTAATNNYKAAKVTVNFMVDPATPSFTWNNPSAITYGTEIDGTQLNAVAGVPGTYVYTPSVVSHTVLHASTTAQPLSVVFTPDDPNYGQVNKTVYIIVNKADPAITWTLPLSVPYGTKFGEITTRASSGSVDGTLSYDYADGDVLPINITSLTAHFVPSNTTDYNSVNPSFAINVTAADPVITWNTLSPIVYGTSLAGLLNASSNGGGNNFTYNHAETDVLDAGLHQALTATFTSSDPAHYNSGSKTIYIDVLAAQPTINLTGGPITGKSFGDAPFQNPVTGTSSVNLPVVVTIQSGNATISNTGEITLTGKGQVVIAYSTAATNNYKAAKVTVNFMVDPATPSFTWNNPSAITYGTEINGTQLNAVASVPGTYVYTPSVVSHTVLHASTTAQPLSVVFTPDDPNYGQVNKTVYIQVNRAMPVINWSAPADITYGTYLSNVQYNATVTVPNNPSVNVAGTFDYSISSPAGAVEPLPVNIYTLKAVFHSTDADYADASQTVTLRVGQATPVITWNPLPVTVGSALTMDQLNASTITTTGNFTFNPPLGTLMNTLGDQQLTAVFTPTDAVNYKTVNASATVNVKAANASAIDPQINWTDPQPISYGTLLSGIQLNATATVPNTTTKIAGIFSYTPDATNDALPVGTHNLRVEFRPTNTTLYNAVSKTVSITVTPVTPVVTWIKPAAVPVGTVLSDVQLDAQTTIDGTFVYTPAAGTVMNTVGDNQPLSVVFHPADTHNYVDNIAANTTIKVYSVDITKITPVINWNKPDDIAYGTPLSATQLNATTADASVTGTFEYSPPAGTTTLRVGAQTLSVTFTPTDGVHYNPATKSVTINVTEVQPVITWASPAAITYGTKLSATQLNATANIEGAFDYSQNDFGTTPNAGTQTLLTTFTPTNNNYPVTGKTVSIIVNKANPVITWANPASIAQGVALSTTQLGATANVDGTFVYTPAIGTILDAGANQTLSVIFTPTDANNYNTITKIVQINVGKLTPVLTWANPTSITYGTALSDQQLYASSTVPGTFTYSPAAGTVLHAGTQALSVTFTPTDAVNYIPVTKTVPINVSKVAVNVSTNDVSRSYNQPNPDFVINYSGFVNGDTQANLTTQASASTTATVSSLVGTYPITVSGASSGDYTFRYVNATLTITTIGRSLTFNQLPVKTYGDADFDAGATATSGEPIIYTTSNSAVATIVNGQIHIVGAGYATITASLPVNPAYNTTPSVSQFMIVNKASQTIDFATIPAQLRGTTYDLSNVKSSSGLPVTFTTNDPMIASINGLTVSSLRVGITGIVANQAGDANYYPANTAVRNLEVKDVTREVIVHPAVSPNGDGINDVLYIEGINEHPDNRVTIINRNGVRVYEINAYDNATKSFDGHSNFTGAKLQAGTYFYLVEYVVNGVGRHLTGYFVLKYE